MLNSHDHSPFRYWGTVTQLTSGFVEIGGLREHANIGAEVRIETSSGVSIGEILKAASDSALALLFSESKDIRLGDRAWVAPRARVAPGDHWLGGIVDCWGGLDESSVAQAGQFGRPLTGDVQPPQARRGLGDRLRTGWCATDSFLPICRGQKVGLFAGSGVGKSTFLGALAGGVEADRIVVAMIGERSREVREFIDTVLPKAVLPKTTVIAAAANEPPGAKRRAAYCALAAAEHFKEQGHHVLLLVDSLTRFAEAHREIGLFSGESPALNAFPPSTVRVISELVERAGPGGEGEGDITAVFSVLVAGSDQEEPLADMIRGILDGHIVLSRVIAERGRYPAIDLIQSVSRSLPKAASQEENEALRAARSLVATYEDLAPMLRAQLYEQGADALSDRAIALFPQLDAFLADSNDGGPAEAFQRLNSILDSDGET